MWWLLLLAPLGAALAPQPQTDIFPQRFPVQPPHCTKTPIVVAHSSHSVSNVVQGLQMQFYIGLHTTVCFRLFDSNSTSRSSWLHTIRLERVEHHHPVSQKYNFAIPEVRAECICECDATSQTCSSQTHKYTRCPESDVHDSATSCYRTFFPNQASAGCPAGSNPKLCCDLKFRPYQSKSYTAVKLEQPSTFATFVYTAYDFDGGKWILKDSSAIRSQLDGGPQNRYIDALRRMELSVSAGGRTSHQLETGMYFAESNPGGEMEYIRQQPLNEESENNFDRLGWYREMSPGIFHVNNGAVRLDKLHNAKVVDCKEQTYRSILDANNYMPGNFNLSRPVEHIYPWIGRARFYDGSGRHVIVSHAEGTSLHITLQVKGDDDGNKLIFFHNSSRISDFSGSIIVDSRSNRFFNLTVYHASGKLDGSVRATTSFDSPDVHTFTAYVHELGETNRSLIIPFPATVDEGPRMVCIRADEEAEDNAVCHVVEYHESPLEVDVEHNTWHELTGHCPECNRVGINGIVKYLNPMSWVQGISSVGDFFMLTTDVLVYIAALIVLYLLLTKIVLPIFQCWICPLYIMRKKKKTTSRRREESGSYV